MFNVGGMQLLVVGLVALIVLGPDKLPAFIRQAGQVVSELRRISTGFQTDLRDALEEAEREATLEEPTKTASSRTEVEPSSPAPTDSTTDEQAMPATEDGGADHEVLPARDNAQAVAAAELEALLAESGSPAGESDATTDPVADDPQPGGGDGPASGSATDAA